MENKIKILNNKYKSNNKIKLYTENLIKFITNQKEKIITIELIEPIDYIIGILFLTESNRYFKQNKINIHAYYMAYAFINLFNKIRLKMISSYKFNFDSISHFILSLSYNIDYLNSRIDSENRIKNKINNNFSKLIIEILPILTNLIIYNKNHEEENKDITINSKFCNEECYSCWVTNILSKFFYLLLQTSKFLGSGSYYDPNLLRLSEYYANIFFTWFKSKNNFLDNRIKLYENYLTYKNKLNYSLIELELNSETLDEIINYIDNEITNNLSII